ncbi:MAG: hypothetical protein PVF50_03065, partial [Gammaproteobacteria bacterium]|jgi:hypothetical protein
MECVEKNLRFLEQVVRNQSWELLRRNPPCVVPDPNGVLRVKEFARARLMELHESSTHIQKIAAT